MNNNYYVYIYWRLDTNEPFYVGMGSNNRWRKLNKGARSHNGHFMRIVNKHPVAAEIIKDNLTEEQAHDIECWLINKLVFEYGFSIDIRNNRSAEKRYHLVNQTWGGEGKSGFSASEETRQIWSRQRTGENNPMYRKDWREGKTEEELKEHSENLSKSHKGLLRGEKNPMYGKNPWDYMAEEDKIKRKKKQSEITRGKNNPMAKSVICLTTKRIFFTAKEGAEYYNIKSSSNIGSCCNGNAKSAGKLPDGTPLVWRFLIWKHDKKYRIKI